MPTETPEAQREVTPPPAKPSRTGSLVLESPDPQYAGEVTFHLPSHYETIQIGVRIAQLSAPMSWEQLPWETRASVRMLATIEFLVDTAPAAFYEDTAQGPLFAPGKLQADDSLLEAIYDAIEAQQNSFRSARLEKAEGTP